MTREKVAERGAAGESFEAEPILWEADAEEAGLPPHGSDLARLLGFPPSRFDEPGLVLGRVHHADRARVEAFWRGAGRARYAEIEYRLCAADGAVVWLRDAVTAFRDEAGKPRLRGVTLDVTAKKARELDCDRRLALLGAALESTADGILVLDVGGRIVASNRRMAEVWGVPAELFAPGPSEAMLEALLAEVRDPAALLRHANRPSVSWERDGCDELELRDGRTLEHYARPHRVEGAAVGVVVSCRDVTAARRAEARYEELLGLESAARAAAEETQCRVQILADDLRRSLEEMLRMQDELVRRERMAALGELASTLAHEVRNSLGATLGAVAELHRRLGREGEVGVLLEIVDEEAKRLSRLVMDLLVFAGPTRGTPRYGSASGLVEDALGAALRTAAPEGPLEVRKSFPEDLPEVYVDEGLFGLALTNVFTNALQAMPGGGALSIEARVRVEGDQTFVELSVADTGEGIEPEVLPRVFEPFFTTKALGTGLGLPIAKRLVEEQRGRIDVSSEPGLGTRFTLLMPC